VLVVHAPYAVKSSPNGVSALQADSLELALVLPARVRAGAPVPIRLRVRNRTERPLDLYLRGRTTTFDVVIAGSDGQVVWRRLEGEVIPAIVHLRTLAPGERLEVEAVWDQRTNAGKAAEPGEYTVRGLLLVEGAPLEIGPLPLRVEPE
jgi:hypothetical protein